MAEVRRFAFPVLTAAIGERPFMARWQAGGPWVATQKVNFIDFRCVLAQRDFLQPLRGKLLIIIGRAFAMYLPLKPAQRSMRPMKPSIDKALIPKGTKV